MIIPKTMGPYTMDNILFLFVRERKSFDKRFCYLGAFFRVADGAVGRVLQTASDIVQIGGNP